MHHRKPLPNDPDGHFEWAKMGIDGQRSTLFQARPGTVRTNANAQKRWKRLPTKNKPSSYDHWPGRADGSTTIGTGKVKGVVFYCRNDSVLKTRRYLEPIYRPRLGKPIMKRAFCDCHQSCADALRSPAWPIYCTAKLAFPACGWLWHATAAC